MSGLFHKGKYIHFNGALVGISQSMIKMHGLNYIKLCYVVFTISVFCFSIILLSVFILLITSII
jgi:hypothetical protein